jgi:hypothetical protein
MLPSSLAPLRTEQSAGSGTREDRGILSMLSSPFAMQGEGADATKQTDPVLSTMNEEDDMIGEDESERLQRGRERNREHARRTRLRKKAQLQELQGTYRAKLAERTQLQQQLQERRIASILLGLSSSTPALAPLGDSSESLGEIREPPPTVSALEEADALFSSAPPMPMSKRKRGFPAVAPSSSIATIHIHGLAIPSKSHINWKTGMYADEMGRPKQMTPQQLEALRYVRIIAFYSRYILMYVHLLTHSSNFIVVQTRTQSHACQNDTGSQEVLRRHHGESH